jgi:hypothetical protein
VAWAKVDDGWWCHPKVIGLSAAARGVWVSALSWSCAQRKDVVPAGLLGMVGGSNDEANELVGAGLWVADLSGWRIHDWAEYQDMSTSEKRAEAGRKGGKASGESRRADQGKQVGSEANEANGRSKDEANGEAGTHPFPSQPVPSKEKTRSTPAATPEVSRLFDEEFWPRCPRKVQKGKALEAFAKALKAGVTPTTIVEGLERMKPEWATRPADKVPHPATWLNAEGWHDEPVAVLREPQDGDRGENADGEEMLYRNGKWFIVRDTGAVRSTQPPVRLVA